MDPRRVSVADHDYFIREADGTIRPEDDVRVWVTWFETAHERGLPRIDEAMVSDNTIRVSTVFLGINQNGGLGPRADEPILFETMIFRKLPQPPEDGSRRPVLDRVGLD